jgi:hypothetical protein
LLALAGLWLHHLRAETKAGPAGIPKNSEPEFQKIFNGHDLTGWSGDTNVWRVENGTITGRVKGSTNWEQCFLEWDEAGLENFELRFQWKWESANMMGRISYRRPAEISAVDEGSYFITLHNYNKDGDYFLWPGISPLKPSERVVVAEDYRQTRTRDLLPGYSGFGQLGDDQAWIESDILVQGGKMLYRVNGRLLAEIQDAQWQSRRHGDRLSLGVLKDGNTQKDALLRFKDVQLKRLPTVTPAVK